MKRRRFLLAGAAACAAGVTLAQSLDYAPPERLSRPDDAGDEGGMWSMMDREERNLRRSPLAIRDPALSAYLTGIACRLAGDHCPDVRVHLVRTPMFNANMAPNGMMQIWTGLLLRMENEAQLAAVIGHEIGHYLQRHSLERLRDVKSKSAVGQFLAVFGVVGAISQLALLASTFSYSRDHEREADRIGAVLMHRAGYDVAESAKVWDNLLGEARAREGKEPSAHSPLFATHPASPERKETLAQYAQVLSGGTTGRDEYARQVARYLDEWMQDEVKRGQYAESLVLFGRRIEQQPQDGLARFYRGEVYRLRGESSDLDAALADYRQAVQCTPPPPRAYRGIGLVARQRNENAAAVEAFNRYLQLLPDAPDAGFIKNYIAELSS